jgi:hypothetical protein
MNAAVTCSLIMRARGRRQVGKQHECVMLDEAHGQACSCSALPACPSQTILYFGQCTWQQVLLPRLAPPRLPLLDLLRWWVHCRTRLLTCLACLQVLDQEGVGQLIRMAVERGRAARPDLKTGICGEQGGEPRRCAALPVLLAPACSEAAALRWVRLGQPWSRLQSPVSAVPLSSGEAQRVQHRALVSAYWLGTSCCSLLSVPKCHGCGAA